jgi:hypothetical protein
MEAVLKELRANASAWPFQKPVNTDEVKDYLDVVKKPMGEFVPPLSFFILTGY